MSGWIEILDNTSLPKENIVVETKIDDKQGVRNICLLKRRNNLWWLIDDSMYVYYKPTHWRKYNQ